MRQVIIKQENLNFRVIGTGRWADYGDSWLAAHDVLHHEPTDKGQFLGEVQSFGTQIWIDHPIAAELNDYAYTLAAVMQDCYDRSKPLKFFRIHEFAPERVGQDFTSKLLPLDVSEFMRRMVAIALSEFLAHPDYSEQEQRKFKFMEVMPYQEMLASWLEFGYLRASERFSTPAQARGLFHGLTMALKEAGRHDIRAIKFSIAEKSGALRFQHKKLVAFDLRDGTTSY